MNFQKSEDTEWFDTKHDQLQTFLKKVRKKGVKKEWCKKVMFKGPVIVLKDNGGSGTLNIVIININHQ